MDLRFREFAANQTDASFALARHVMSTHAKDANFVFSPLSLHVLLGLVAAGSNAPTRDQILGFLKLKSMEELTSLSAHITKVVLADGEPLGGPRLSFANSVWVDRSVGLNGSFKQIVEKDYMAALTHVDFRNKADEVIEEVNAWAEKETGGLIKQILPADESSRLILANAVYFKGAWGENFDASLTKEHEFFLLNGSSVEAPFMTSNKKQYIRAFDGFKVLGLYNEQGEDDKRGFTMTIFLPDAKDGLPNLIQKFCSDPNFILHHLPYVKVGVTDFRIPKFKIGLGFEASEVLQAQGVDGPFTFGGLSGQLLCVSRIFHKSFIEVNEIGTEAVAEVAFRSLWDEPPPPLEFVADHPFLFVIREYISGVVLFIGQVLNPLDG